MRKSIHAAPIGHVPVEFRLCAWRRAVRPAALPHPFPFHLAQILEKPRNAARAEGRRVSHAKPLTLSVRACHAGGVCCRKRL